MSTDDPLIPIIQRIIALEKEVERMKGYDVPKARDPFYPVDPVITSVNFNPATKSTTAKTQIVMSTEFPTAPTTEVVGYYFYVACRDSGSAAGSAVLILSNNNGAGNGSVVSAQGLTNDGWARNMVYVPCDSSGNIYYSVVATGVNTFDFYLMLAGWVWKS